MWVVTALKLDGGVRTKSCRQVDELIDFAALIKTAVDSEDYSAAGEYQKQTKITVCTRTAAVIIVIVLV